MKTLDKSDKRYTIDTIRDEARQLVEKGCVSRHQPIYILCQYIPAREWVCVECELEQCEYLLRDEIANQKNVSFHTIPFRRP